MYNGAINGYADLGRDPIVRCVDEVLIIQTKCWARSKLIQEKHISQLFGTMSHFNLTLEKAGRPTKAVFYYLPFDPNYDKIKIDLHRDEYFVKTVKEAVQKGFRRARN